MEARLFDPNDPPAWADPTTTAEWHHDREHAPHIDQGAHQPRLYAAARFVLAYHVENSTICDLGAGDGGLLQFLKRELPWAPLWGYDLMPANIHAAERRGVHVMQKDVVNDDKWVGATTMICTEFLEHLIDPHAFVRKIAGRVPKLFVASSPVNETAESHYAHHTWAWDADGYNTLMTQAGFEVIDRWQDEMFQVVACSPKT